MLFISRLAPFCAAFCTFLPCVLHQNALRLAAYCTAFCTILHYILLQTAPKQVQMPVAYNKYSLCRTHKLTPFSIKTNPRENRFFGASGRLVDKKDSHNVKIYTEKRTKEEMPVDGLMGLQAFGIKLAGLAYCILSFFSSSSYTSRISQTYRTSRTSLTSPTNNKLTS